MHGRRPQRAVAQRWLRLILLVATLAMGNQPVFAAPTHTDAERTALALAHAAPHANRVAVKLAVAAMECAMAQGQGSAATRLAVIDYSLPSLQPRLWVFDVASHTLLFEELVAHGKGSGDNYATTFSNDDDSRASSLGLFLTGDVYQGHNGTSLRLIGLEPGTNDHALRREIVIHGADYVDAEAGLRQGRIGRSWGCPAVRRPVLGPLVDAIKQGNFVFAYYPDRAWLAHSSFLRCAEESAESSRSLGR
jgi:L,D-transpeptidase catalytic domain